MSRNKTRGENDSINEMGVTVDLNFDNIEISFDESKKLVTLKNEGRRSYPKVRDFIKEVRRKMKGLDPRLNLLIDWTEFQGFGDAETKMLEPSAIELSELVRKVVIIAGPEWDFEADRWVDFFCYISIKRFRPDDRNKATDCCLSPHSSKKKRHLKIDELRCAIFSGKDLSREHPNPSPQTSRG